MAKERLRMLKLAKSGKSILVQRLDETEGWFPIRKKDGGWIMPEGTEFEELKVFEWEVPNWLVDNFKPKWVEVPLTLLGRTEKGAYKVRYGYDVEQILTGNEEHVKEVRTEGDQIVLAVALWMAEGKGFCDENGALIPIDDEEDM